MRLITALRLGPAPYLALVGAGGKTTALFRLARDYLQAEPASQRVLVAATTHLAAGQLDLADRHYVLTAAHQVANITEDLPAGVLLFTGPLGGDGRTAGLETVTMQVLASTAKLMRAPLLVEADGSRQIPLKAPAEHEPVIPPGVEMVLVVAGLSALGQPLTPAWVHRPERFAELSGLSSGEPITPEGLAAVLAHPQGGLKAIPPTARRVVLLNQADTPAVQAAAQRVAERLLPAYDALLVTALNSPEPTGPVLVVHEKVAGVLLAAGEAVRLGQPKQVLEWRGEPFVRHIIRSALAAGLTPLVVVTGAHAGLVQKAVADLPVSICHNPDFSVGQSSSVATGIRCLPPETGAAIFLLADQPQVPTTLLRRLVELHSTSLAPLIAPMVDGKRANPVLFDRVTFPELLALQGDTGGRALFSRYPIAWLPWHDPDLALDVDTLEDYQRLLSRDE